MYKLHQHYMRAMAECVVAPSAATLSCDMSTSTHVGELRRAALRRSMRACRERWPECLLRRAGEVGVSGLRLGEIGRASCRERVYARV